MEKRDLNNLVLKKIKNLRDNRSLVPNLRNGQKQLKEINAYQLRQETRIMINYIRNMAFSLLICVFPNIK